MNVAVNNPNDVLVTDEHSDLKIELENSESLTTPPMARIMFHGSLAEIIVMVQQLVWIAASFRQPKYGQVSYSEAVLEHVKETTFNINLLELEAVRERASACWLPLFTNAIVARGFPVPARKGEKGIEVPFLVMTGLANVMYPVIHHERVYLRGTYNLLFPTGVSPDLRSVQWHMTTNPNPRSRLPYGALPNEGDGHKWLQFEDFGRLASAARTFLGNCGEVQVHLGTENSIA